MGKSKLLGRRHACILSDRAVLIRSLAVNTETPMDDGSHQPPSQNSPSSAVSDDPSESRWSDIFSPLSE